MNPYRVSIVMIGNWNKYIFNHVWLKKNIFKIPQKDQIHVQIDFEKREFAYAFEGINVLSNGSRLELSIEEFTKDSLTLMESFASRFLKLLPETPITGIGLNYEFMIPKKENPFTKMILPVSYKGLLREEIKFSLKNRKYTTSMFVGREELNKVGFNFHYDAKSNFIKGISLKHLIECGKYLKNEQE